MSLHLDTEPHDDACGLCLGTGVCPECHGTGDRPEEKGHDEVARLRSIISDAALVLEAFGHEANAAYFRAELVGI